MGTPPSAVENELSSSIPPVICNNPREKIEAEEVPIDDVLQNEKYKVESKEVNNMIIPFTKRPVVPLYPLSLQWSPSVIFFEIDNTFILQKIRFWIFLSMPFTILVHGFEYWRYKKPMLISAGVNEIRIWNACSRSIYILCCGLWGESARLGAKWRCYPRTRFLLSPGLTADLFIKATPKEQSPVPSAHIAIQLAAAHKRDPVVGYFVIPIIVKFLKYTKPCLGEEEVSNNSIETVI